MPTDELIRDLLIYFGPPVALGLFFATGAIATRVRERRAARAAESRDRAAAK